MSEKRIALLFAGAGASKAVNAKQYPTTVEFYNSLPAEIKTGEILDKVLLWFNETRRKHVENLDIEVVLWALDELSRFLEELQAAQSFPMFALRRDYLTQWAPRPQGGSKASINPTLQRYHQISPKLESLRSKITAQVYDLYSELPAREELEQNWLPLLEGLLVAGFTLELFTTNYDLVLEQALTFLKSPIKPNEASPQTDEL